MHNVLVKKKKIRGCLMEKSLDWFSGISQMAFFALLPTVMSVSK